MFTASGRLSAALPQQALKAEGDKLQLILCGWSSLGAGKGCINYPASSIINNPASSVIPLDLGENLLPLFLWDADGVAEITDIIDTMIFSIFYIN